MSTFIQRASLILGFAMVAACSKDRAPAVPLHADEVTAARHLFGDQIDLDIVRKRLMPMERVNRITGGPLVAEVANERDVDYFVPSFYADNFAAKSVHSSASGLFAHELTHIWQFQTGWKQTLCKTGENGTYDYTLKRNAAFSDYCMEQQGSIVQDYYLRFHHPTKSQPFYSRYHRPEMDVILADIVESVFPAARTTRVFRDFVPPQRDTAIDPHLISGQHLKDIPLPTDFPAGGIPFLR